jgi:hypothetical protein
MTKLKNISGEVGYLGHKDGKRIEVGEVIDVEGVILPDSPDDAYLIGEAPPDLPEEPTPEQIAARDAVVAALRLYHKSQWQATGGKTKSEGNES